jgi:hypothetical protein
MPKASPVPTHRRAYRLCLDGLQIVAIRDAAARKTQWSRHCSGSGRFLTGSGLDFRKHPDPYPDLVKFMAKFLLKTFFAFFALKSIGMTQKVKNRDS